MNLLKKSVLLVAMVAMIPSIAEASANDGKSQNALSKHEVEILTNDVGLTMDEISEFPNDVLRELIKQDAHKLKSNRVRTSMEAPLYSLTQGEDIELFGTGFTVTSDKSGYKKIYLYGSFEWLESPLNAFTDKMTIGFPDSSKWFLPMSSGKVAQHESRYAYDQWADGRWSWTTKQYTPSDWEPNAGVAAEFDLIGLLSSPLHKGYVSQYVYVSNQESNISNVKFEYGHAYTGIDVEVAVFPSAGLAINPGIEVESESYGIEVDY